MKADLQKIKRDLKTGNFDEIFKQELGWDNLRDAPVEVSYKGQKYLFTSLAQKKGFKIYLHSFPDRIPEEQLLKQLDRGLNDFAAAHLTIFVNAKRENQAWLWVKQVQEGKKVRLLPRLYRYNKNQNGESLVQKIDRLFIDLDEEENITLTGVLDRVMQGFDVEKVTKTFYERFKKEHADFMKQIEHITDENDRRWYTSIMLNRLMFVYFLQKKKILDNKSAVRFEGKDDYLENRLAKVREEYGPDNFYAFYRYFLRSLFHDGLNQPEPHSPELERLIGKVPHINGGIFDVHPLEDKYQDIQIKDEAFKQLFEFFREFDWHLDNRPTRNDKEINPDVLGYIFEKYINQKQMGAYYTKEDITDYISKNTIIPFLFEKVAQRCPEAFGTDGPIWLLLKENPDDYIYEEIAHGLLEPLPEEIAAGLADVEQRTLWNKTAEEQWALPTETWREVIERRHRYMEIHDKISKGEITSINDLITYNLNITQFASDVIANCQKPALLRAFYDAITQVTVLDPTCGSGAFLFAALNILKPLYQTCIDHMRQLLKEQERLPDAQRREIDQFTVFQHIIERVDLHPNEEYFILKSIMINNLYGVDIMEEGIEICKLRLFLKLVAQVENPRHLEPLPDIDFNVLPGNTLIGFTSMDEVRRVVTTKLINIGDTEKTLQRIEQLLQEIERAVQNFRGMQTELGIKADPSAKRTLREKFNKLRTELNPYLATEYGIYASKYDNSGDTANPFTEWQISHKPFHWWAEFYTIMQNGGFDVIIGNPPYVEWSKIKEYNLLPNKYNTKNCGNLYTVVCERSYSLLRSTGFIGMIVPISCVSTDRMQALRGLWQKKNFETYISHYSGDAHPSVLFQGVKFRLSIVLQHVTSSPTVFSTHFQKWFPEGREQLFSLIRYAKVEPVFIRSGLIPKIASEQHANILRKLCSEKSILQENIASASEHQVYCHRIVAHFIKAVDFIPFFRNERDGQKKSEDYKVFPCTSKGSADIIAALLNSSLFYSWFVAFSDVYHCGREMILSFPCSINRLLENHEVELCLAKDRLMENLQANSVRRSIPYKATGLVEYDEFYPRKSKPIIDEIDRVLAQHYGFTPEELDFIINYDIKYRMGRDNGEEGEE